MRKCLGTRRLKLAEKDQHDDDQQKDAYATRGCVAPIAAVRPPRKHSQERHYQENDQYGSDHHLFPSRSKRFANFRVTHPGGTSVL